MEIAMKRSCAVLLLCTILLCSCVSNERQSYVAQSAVESQAETDTAYESIERKSASGYSSKYFAKKDDSCVLSIDIPKDWTLSEADGSYNILRDNAVIGNISYGDADTDGWTSVFSKSEQLSSISFKKHVERNDKEDRAEYRYRVIYEYTDRNDSRKMTLCVDCAEVDKMTESKLQMNAVLKDKISSDTLGVLSDIKNADSILILGNSFIGTSDIEAILYEMLYRNGKNCHVLGLSRGYATVETYINDTALMRDVRSGLYDAVFICGFYNSSEIDNLRILKNECDAPKTKLVIFPAHNENSGVISQACRQFPELTCLNWKNEIDALIKKGVARSDFCINDQHQHSTELAGYVGAHMIYRALYGTVPAKPYINAIEHSLVDKLGDYVTKGDIVEIDTAKINILG